ncbi:hypothetical protein [Williamsia sp.]|uniref:hypothetical protein n=1 Tax=Williamsia sp. TaxID=1872085 RepID=UPI002F94D31E
MDQHHDGPAGGSGSGGDADAWRALLIGILEKVDLLAGGLLGDESGARGRGTSGGGTAASSGDFSAQFRSTLEFIIEEAGDLIWQMLGQLIAILEAIQQALEHVMGGTPGAAATSSSGGGRRSEGVGGRGHAYEPITVHFESPDGPPAGSV